MWHGRLAMIGGVRYSPPFLSPEAAGKDDASDGTLPFPLYVNTR